MTIKKMIQEAQHNYDKWRLIVARGTHQQHNRTEIQAIMLRERFEGRLEALMDAQRLIQDKAA